MSVVGIVTITLGVLVVFQSQSIARYPGGDPTLVQGDDREQQSPPNSGRVYGDPGGGDDLGGRLG